MAHLNKCMMAVLAFFVILSVAHAYEFSPAVVRINTNGNNSNQIYKLENNSDNPIAIEISINRFKIDMNGKNVDLDEDVMKNFIIYPQRIILMPKETRFFQVSWIGPPDLPETAYFITTKQVPMDIDDQKEKDDPGVKAEVVILMHYKGCLYVAPPKSKPSLLVDSVAGWEKESPELEIVCTNKGNGRASMRLFSLKLIPLDQGGKPLSGKSITLYPSDHNIQTAFLPGDSIRLTVPWPQKLPVGPVRVEFKPSVK